MPGIIGSLCDLFYWLYWLTNRAIGTSKTIKDLLIVSRAPCTVRLHFINQLNNRINLELLTDAPPDVKLVIK